MLVEFIGQPAAGKTRLAEELAKLAPGWTRITGLRRRLGAALLLGYAAISPADKLIAGICRAYCKPGIRRLRRTALLRNYRRHALRQQRASDPGLSDQLFLHALYCTIGPQRHPAQGLLDVIGTLIDQTYSVKSVAFIHVKPAAAQWHQQLRRSPHNKTRFSILGDPELIEAVKGDLLYQAGIVDALKAKGHWVLDVVPGLGTRPSEMAAECFKAITTRLRVPPAPGGEPAGTGESQVFANRDVGEDLDDHQRSE